MTKQELIDEVMDNFDFRRVLKTMQALDWVWAGVGVPEDEYQVRKFARKILKEATESKFCATGGFEAEYDDKDGGFLSLKFVVTDWSAYEDE